MSTSTTIGLSIGKFIGNGAAFAVHGAARAASATGEFGKAVAAGATEQYAVKSTELAAHRAALRAQAVKALAGNAPAPQKNKAAVTKRRVAA